MIQSVSDNQFIIQQAIGSAARRLRAANVNGDTAAGIVLAIIEALGNIARHATGPRPGASPRPAPIRAPS